MNNTEDKTDDRKETGGAAFAAAAGDSWQDGMDLRPYAAIHLRIPDSGIDWLDEMIAKAEKRDIAAKAMQGMSANPEVSLIDMSTAMAKEAYKLADAVVKEQGWI